LALLIATPIAIAAAMFSASPAPAPVVEATPASPAPSTLERLEVPHVPASEAKPRTPSRAALRRYLTRPVARSVRHRDHGVIEVGVGLGLPHLYRLELQVGLLDHVTLGATAHWLPGQARPGWSPKAAVAFYRGRLLEV